MEQNHVRWLLESNEPWTRYRTLVDLLDLPQDDPQVQAAYQAMLVDQQVRSLVAAAAAWPGYALKRHNDASHPIVKLSTLADFGLQAAEAGLKDVILAVLAHQSPQGAFQSLVNIPQAYSGTGQDTWSWMLCDAPTLLYALLAMGSTPDERLTRAVEHLAALVSENGYRCTAAPELGKFKGPGRRSDPCPIANVYALKALSLVPSLHDSPATRAAVDMLLFHWEVQKERKFFLFGIGSDFRKLKYPFIWYDILHVVEVLSRYPFTHDDPRFREMLDTLASQADSDGLFTAGSMYQVWKVWSFADKKNPSPWLTFLVWRIFKRTGYQDI